MYEDSTEWRVNRLKNYAAKLMMSKAKAQKRLMLFTDLEKLLREYDRIVDRKFWSSNEPGLSHKERERRLKMMYKDCAPEAIQLSLFDNNKNLKHGTTYSRFRLQRTVNRSG